jgi:hypothetical protein
MISLAVKDRTELENLMKTLDDKKIGYIAFYEPDVNEITAIVLDPSVQADKATSHIKLAGRKVGDLDKHSKH